MANKVNFKVGYQVDQTSLNQIRTSLQSLQLLTANDLMNLNKSMHLPEAKAQLDQIKKSALEVENAISRSFNTNLGTLNVTRFNEELKKINLGQLYNDFSAAGTIGQTAFRNLTTQILTTNKHLKESHSVLDAMAITLKNSIKWTISSAAINSFTGSIQQAYGYVKSLDRSLNDIRIVTNKSADDMANFAVQANKAAQSLAASTTDYTNASLIYYQQGLSDEEVAARTEVTLKAANVTQQNTAEVSEQLTAVWNGYKVSAEEAELYVDKIAAVAATTASNLEELSTGMSRVASAAALMGVDVDQLNAQLSTIISVTRQAPESVGTALKSIYARISDIESGIDTETTLGHYTAKMLQYGINVLNANNELRNMGEVIEEVGEKWAGFTREQQTGLAQAMAGTRQYVNLLALFENWDNYTAALETSRNALGTLQEQQDIYIDGTQAALQRLKTAQEDLYDSLLDSSSIKNVADGLRVITNQVTSFVDAIGGGQSVLFGLGAVASQVFGKMFASSIATTISNFQGLKQNALDVQAQLEILQQFKGIDITDESTQRLIAMKEQMLEYRNVLTTTQQEEADNLIRTTNELQNQKTALDEAKQAAQSFYQTHTERKINFDNITDEVSLNNYIKVLKDIQIEYRGATATAKDYNDALKRAMELDLELTRDDTNERMMAKYTAALKGINYQIQDYVSRVAEMVQYDKVDGVEKENLIKLLKEYNLAVKDSRETLERGRLGTSNLGEALINDRDVQRAAQAIVDKYTEIANKVEQQARTAANTLRNEFNGASRDVQNNLNNVGDAFQNMMQRASLETTIRQYVQLASTLGQVAFAYNSLVNILNTWKNENIDFTQKVSQSLIFFGTTLPMLINSFTKLNEIFGTTNIIIGITNGLKERAAALDAKTIVTSGIRSASLGLETVKEKELAAAILQKIQADGLDIHTATRWQIHQAIKNASQEMGIQLYTHERMAILKKIDADRLEAASITKKTVIQEAFNKSLLSNPYVLAIAGITALISVIGTVNQMYEKNIQKQIESAKATRDQIISNQSEIDSLQSLYNEYSNYYNIYSETGENKDELTATTEKLIEALGDEASTLDLLSDSYKYVNEQIELLRKNKAKAQLETLKGQIAEVEGGLLQEAGVDRLYEEYAGYNINFKGAQTEISKQISERLAEEIENLNLDVDISKLGTIGYFGESGDVAESGLGEFSVIGVQTVEQIKQIYDTVVELRTKLATEFKESGKDISQLMNDPLYQALGEWSKSLSASIEDVNKVYEQNLQLAAIEAKPDDSYKVKTFDQFVKYRDEYLDNLKETLEEQGVEYTAEEMEKQVDTALKGINDTFHGFVQEFNVKEELHNKLTDGWDEVEAFIQRLEKEGRLNIVAVAGVQEGDTIAVAEQKAADTQAKIDIGALDRAQAAQDALDAIGKEKKTKKEIKELEESLKELGSQYEKLGAIQDRTSHEYLATLRQIKEEEEKTAERGFEYERAKALQEYQEELKKVQEAKEKFDSGLIDEAEFKEQLNAVDAALQNFLEADHNLKLAVEIDLDTDVRDAFGLAKEFEQLRDVIHDDLYYTIDEAQELIDQGFGEMFENADAVYREIEGSSKRASEIMIQVNKEVQDAFIDARQAELQADKEAKIQQLENEWTLLEAQKQAALAAAEAARAAANASTEEEAAAALEKLQIAQEEYNAKTNALNEMLGNEETYATESQNINQTLFDALGGMYDTNSTNFQQAEIDATNTQRSEIEKRLANVQLLANAYGQLADQVKASEEGNNLNVQIARGAQGGGGINVSGHKSVETKNIKVNKISNTDVIKESLDLFNRNREQYRNTMNAVAEEAEARAAAISSQQGSIKAGIAALNAADAALDRRQRDAKAGGGGGKGKSGKEKDPDTIDYLEDEADRYHDINLEIERLNVNLERLNKEQEKLYGKKLVDNLNEQLKVLKDQVAVYKIKKDMMKEEQKELRDILSAQGVTFNDENGGYISNYEAALKAKFDETNNLIFAYNSMSAAEQEQWKDTVEKAKEDYEKFKEQIERYDELISSEIPELEDTLTEKLNQQIEININKFTMEVELRLDMAEAERDFNEFRRKVIDNIKDDNFFSQNIIDNAKAKLRDLASYFRLDPDVVEKYGNLFNIEGEEGDYFSSLNKKQEEIDSLYEEAAKLEEELYDIENSDDWTWEQWDPVNEKLDETYNKITDLEDELSNLEEAADFGGDFAFESGIIGPIQKLTDQVNDTMAELDKMGETVWSDVYGDNQAKGLEDLENYYQELIQQMEDIVDLVDEIKESYLDMIDKAIEDFDRQVDQYEYIADLLDHNMNVVGLVYGDKAYEKMANYYRQIEQNNNQELDFLKKRVAYAEEMMNKETDPKARRAWEEEWMNSLEKLNKKVEDSIQNIIDKYANAIELTFDKLNKKVTGGKGLDYVTDEWDLINKNADQYLDTINALYGIQKLENKYLEALDNTDNLSSQKKLNDMMNEQLEMLRSKDKLTQYDVDRANMLYDIMLKQIALEEAQQNKTKLRLRRDSQGNYNYQFVADDEEIGKAQDDLLTAKNDLYNFDKERYKENLNQIYEYYLEFQEKYKEIMLDMSLTDEERQQRTLLLQEQYGQLINGLVEQNEDIKLNLYESAFDALEGMYEANAESFLAMTGQEIEAFRNLTNEGKDLILVDLIPQWDSGVQHMADVFAGEGGFIPTCTEAFQELDDTTVDYKDSLDELERAAGIDFESIGRGYDSNIEKAQALLQENDKLIQNYRNQITEIKNVIDQLDFLMTKYGEVQRQAEAAATAAYKYLQAQKELAAESVTDVDYEPNPQVSGGSAWVTPEYPTGAGSSGSSGGSSGGSGSGGSRGGSGTSTTTSKNNLAQNKTPKKYKLSASDASDVVYSINKFLSKKQQSSLAASLIAANSRGYGVSVTTKKDKEAGTYYQWKDPNKKIVYSFKKPSDYTWLATYRTGGYTGEFGNEGRLGVLHEKELVLNQNDTQKILDAVGIVRDISGLIDNINNNMLSRMIGLSAGLNAPMSGISALNDTLEQNVHIEASFPGVQNSREIEDAFNNLVNIASQRAFRNRKS